MAKDESGIYAYEFGVKVDSGSRKCDYVSMEEKNGGLFPTLTLYYDEQVSYDYEDGSHLGTQRKVTIPLKKAIDILFNHPEALERIEKGEYE